MNVVLYLTIFLIGMIIGFGINLGLNEKISKKNTIIYGALIGLLFVIYAFSIKLNNRTMASSTSWIFALGIIYILTLLTISIIDGKKREINKKILLFGFMISAIYNLFIYSEEQRAIMYSNLAYLIITCILLIINTSIEKRKGKPNYTIDILILSMYMVTFIWTETYLISVGVALFAIAIYLLINKIKNRDRKHVKINKKINMDLPIAFFLGISNIVVVILLNILGNYLSVIH